LNKTDLRHFLNDIKLKGTENKSTLIKLAIDKVVSFMETIPTHDDHIAEMFKGKTWAESSINAT